MLHVFYLTFSLFSFSAAEVVAPHSNEGGEEGIEDDYLSGEEEGWCKTNKCQGTEAIGQSKA